MRDGMRILVWQWGRFGAGPRIALDFAAAFNAVPGVEACLSLSRQSEIMQADEAPACDLPIDTYRGVRGYLRRIMEGPALVAHLRAELRRLAPDLALCAMPGPLDLAMQQALRQTGIPMAVVVHDADPHPGDGYPMQMTLQRMLVKRADAIVALSEHVAERLRDQGLVGGLPLIRGVLPQPPIVGLAPVRAHGGPFRLLSFGRLLAYKGLDLLAEALGEVLPDTDMVVRIVGQGPDSAALEALARLPRVSVENRWVPEAEIASLLGWADGVVLSHREASQSGVAAAALAARRFLVATRVGGLVEQAGDDPAAILCEVSAAGLATGLRRMLVAPAPAAATAMLDVVGLVEALAAVRLGAMPVSWRAPVPAGGAGWNDAWAGRRMRRLIPPKPPRPPSIY
jgi:glycosyltransferase involved in cell wall biosynthesis